MTEPTSSSLAAYGVWAKLGPFMSKYAALTAGFVGSVMTLSFLEGLSRSRMYLAIITGAGTAHYLTGLVLWVFSIPTTYTGGVAFLIGTTAMNIIPGLMKLSESVHLNPSGAIQALLDLLKLKK